MQKSVEWDLTNPHNPHPAISLYGTDTQYVILKNKQEENVEWDFTNPQNPHGEPQKSPSYCLTDIPIQAAGHKDPPNWNYLDYSRYIA